MQPVILAFLPESLWSFELALMLPEVLLLLVLGVLD
jgi:hypothetical protein